jgi:hypothetical protein
MLEVQYLKAQEVLLGRGICIGSGSTKITSSGQCSNAMCDMKFELSLRFMAARLFDGRAEFSEG